MKMTLGTVLLQIGKSQIKIQNGLLFCLRMCNHEANRARTLKGKTSNQDEVATYGAKEFFQYNEYSFNDIHLETGKYRLPRPSSKSNKGESK